MAEATGSSPPSPNPVMKRNTMSIQYSVLSPLRKLPREYRRRVTTMTLRLPHLSAMFPERAAPMIIPMIPELVSQLLS